MVGEYTMEKRVKKKAALYGVLAILSASVIVVLAYNIGVYNLWTDTLPPPVPTKPSTLLQTFNSNEELLDFLVTNSETQGPFPFFGPEDVTWFNARGEGFDAQLSSPGLVGFKAEGLDYSITNIQVAGVDEADVVKTDGEYLYLLINDALLIMKAYPPETTELLTNMTFNDLHPIGIFVNEDRLTVLGSKYFIPKSIYPSSLYVVDVRTFARVYDIQNRSNPVLLRDIMLTGSYFNSRMIGDYVYFVVSQPAYVIYDTLVLPKIYSHDRLVRQVLPTEIQYYNGSDNYYQYTTLVSLNIQDATEAPTYLPLMLGGTSSMYVSHNNMFITFPEFNGNTTVYRVNIKGNNMTAEAEGQVAGNVLNQFSMDEYNGYFRIATMTWKNGSPRSNVFVMDMDLKVVGKLLDIEVGETLDSARFVENRCYLSTSVVRRDPFFVVDVENATAPRILGYLKIPGLNRYLHPYDENHVIGLGRDESNNVKISLFDVTDVSSPKNISEYKFEASWSDTPALWDHKAFLFAKNENLLAIPVSTTQYNGVYKTEQSLFVFNITLTHGITLRGNITHQEQNIEGWDTRYHVKRALYIEEVLYSISDKKVKLNNLEDLTFIKEVLLS
jgi:uncharacterized secreted protein with C-terminal beta-propeller domain